MPGVCLTSSGHNQGGTVGGQWKGLWREGVLCNDRGSMGKGVLYNEGVVWERGTL